jgi:hypothetical protein
VSLAAVSGGWRHSTDQDETARGAMFQNCLGPVFRDINYDKITSTDGKVAYPGGAIDYQGVRMIFK